MPDTRLTCACAAGLLLLASAARADRQVSLAVATGQYGMRKEIPHSLGVDVELRSSSLWNLLRPVAGLLTSGRGAILYSGLILDLDLPLGMRLSPGFAPALAVAGADGDLGFPLEFRSSLELSLAAGDRVRIGVAFSHISNARLGDKNPGVEVLAVGIAVSPGR